MTPSQHSSPSLTYTFAQIVHGTHYCDITGETDFVREMVDTYDDLARESGAFIISSCGNDCVPWDLLCEFTNLHVLESDRPNIVFCCTVVLECVNHFNKTSAGGDEKVVKVRVSS